MNISKITSSICPKIKKVANGAYKLVRQIPADEVVMKNIKKAAPIAAASIAGFGLFGLLKNKRRDGKQGKLEKASNTFAKAAFAVGAFNKFFKIPKSIPIKDGAFDISLSKILKQQKLNIAAYAIGIVGVGLATTILTKVVDKFTKPKALNENA